MWYILPAHTPLYRAGWTKDQWPDILQGYGSFFAAGGRYNTTHQQTVYASPDPVVALTEFGWHWALERCEDLGNGKALSYPFKTAGKLWRFEFTTPLILVDVAHAGCIHHFGYPAHAPYNPHPNRYAACRQLADQVRQWAYPPPPNTRPEGLLAPSVRTPGAAQYVPQQVVLFVMPAPTVVPQTLQARGALLGIWDIELEFSTPGSRQPVSAIAPLVGWQTPRVRLSGQTNPVPRYATRSNSRAIPVNQWRPLDIRYSLH